MKRFTSIITCTLALGGTAAQSSTASSASALPTVDLGYAVHQGTINASGYAYYNFSNIRYGESPTGALRFAAPIAPTKINRTLNTGQIEVICPQANPAWELTSVNFLSGANISTLSNSSNTGNASFSSIPAPDPRTSEDCLFLDVMVPKSIYDKRDIGYGAPVLVWIYGGGYTAGYKTQNGNPATLLARSRDNNDTGLIYVAINYRLGLYGWLSGPTFQTSGTANAGLYDQELALKWVQNNIAKFGGDPNRVTVMGESAGGGSIMHQVTAYGGLKGKVPFQQLIAQSPGFFPDPGNAQQEDIYLQTLKYASLIAGKSITSVQQLRNLTAQQLYGINYAIVGTSSYGTFTFGPVVDGSFVPKLPGELLLHGRFDKTVRVMVGHNLNEGAFFASPFLTNDTAFKAFVYSRIPSATSMARDYITQTLYPPIFNGSYGYKTQFQRTSVFISEVSFTCNTRFLDLAYKNKTYSYYFTVPPGLHGADVAYTFFNGDTSTSIEGSAVNVTVANALQNYITSFAATGQPNEPGVPFFPIYGSNSSTQVLGIEGFGSQVKDTAANERCTWWQKGLYY